MRRKLDLSQTEFADRYGIPLSCIHGWESRQSKPDAGMMSYLQVIEADPEGTAKAYANRRIPQAAE